MIRDKVVLGLSDKNWQLKLLHLNDAPLSKIVNLCREAEATQNNKEALKSQSSAIIAKVEKSTYPEKNCFRCGEIWNKKHSEICPAKRVACNRCGLKGYYAKCCKSKSRENNLKVQQLNWPNNGKEVDSLSKNDQSNISYFRINTCTK